jgi:outer membrane receptor for ferrienterochelin and colicin
MKPYSRQSINKQDLIAVKNVLLSESLTKGPKVLEFEKKIANYVKSNYAVACNSATSGLHLACLALGLKKNDLVWTSSNTFVASANAPALLGCKIDFLDISLKDFNIDLDKLEKKLKTSKKKPKVIINVHFAGKPSNQKKIYNLSKIYNFKIIEDASHALGAKKNDFLVGAAIRNTVYDDNTTATSSEFGGLNNPNKIFLPGIFVQNEYKIDSAQSILAGIRYDYNSVHKNIVTPRLAYKIILQNKSIIRLNSGTGFRAVNLFTEDHAALTGARKVVILENLNPEKSFNTNLNYTKKFSFNNKKELTIDLSAFYTYFNNRIIPDYLTDPNLIIYKNINGYGVSRGLSMNVDFDFNETTDIILGGTFLDVFIKENQQKNQQILTENFSASWTISHKIEKYDLRIDYTGNVFSPMQLPLIGELDPRNEKSPWWSIQNIQFVYLGIKNFEIYGGIKNIFNFLPGKNNPFLIARANDPFDKNIKKDSNGNVIATPDNPYALSFDPTYVFAPNQGRRYFLGLRYSLF